MALLKRCLSVLIPVVAVVPLVLAQNPQSPVPPSHDSSLAGQPPATAAPANPAEHSTPATANTIGPSVPAQGSGVIEGNDPLLQPPPLPPGQPSLIGGIVGKIDRIKSSVVVRPFGGNSMKIYFDERTHIYRDGVETTQLGIRKGDRVYVDTLLDGAHVFAKKIRVETQGHIADARGQLLSYDRKGGRIAMRDELTSQPVNFSISSDTVVRHGGTTGTISDLQPGSLIDVRFAPESAGRGIAREINIYAAPGASFTFSGKVTYLNMKSGTLAVQNQTDNKNYEIRFEPHASSYEGLEVGADVTIQASFDGSHYRATSVSMNEAAERKQ